MTKKFLVLCLLSAVLAACVVQPGASPATVTLPARTAESQQPTAMPEFIATTAPIPTLGSDKVKALTRVLYTSDPELPQYDPQSVAYAQFADALGRLSAMGPGAIDAASYIARAISFPRQESSLAAKALISLGPDIIATTIPVLLDNLDSPTSTSRLYSLIVLSTVKGEAFCAVGNIGPLLWDRDPQVRFAAALALQEITGNALLPGSAGDTGDLLSADAMLADTPEGELVRDARTWWTEKGASIDWHSTYGTCDP